MYSIRNRLNLTIITSMILVLSLAAVFMYNRVAGLVEEVFDTALFERAQGLISLTELDEEGLEFDFAEKNVMHEFQGGDNPQYYQLWEGGELLIKSPTLGSIDLPRPDSQLEQHQYVDLLLPDGRSGRMIEIIFMPRVEMDDKEEAALYEMLPTAKPITLVFAREREALNGTLFIIGLTISGIVIAVLIFAAILIRNLIGIGLSPLSNLANQVSGIDESKLDARLTHEGRQSIELAPIEKQLNHLLERLHSAFEREKRFSANVAHELRTPLAELKTLAEVGLMVPEDVEQVTEFFKDVGNISSQMEKVVITLLELARSEAGLLSSDPEDIELFNYCDFIWNHAANGQAVNKKLIKNIPEELVIQTDREKLGMILNNLFINAISYSPEHAEIEISAEIRNEYVVLEVKNNATDLKPEDIVHMKDRFWRKQQAHGEHGNSGLGLTLVEALAGVLQLDFSLQMDNQQMFMATLSGLPQSLSLR